MGRGVARPLRVVPLLVHLLLVGRDVEALDPDLAAPDAAEGLGERTVTPAERLDLGAGEHQTGLETLDDLVVVTRSAVGDDGLLSGGVAFGAHRPRRLGSGASPRGRPAGHP